MFLKGGSQSLYLFIRRGLRKILLIMTVHHCHQLHTKLYPTSVKLTPYLDNIFWLHQCGFDVADQLLIMCSAFIRY